MGGCVTTPIYQLKATSLTYKEPAPGKLVVNADQIVSCELAMSPSVKGNVDRYLSESHPELWGVPMHFPTGNFTTHAHLITDSPVKRIYLNHSREEYTVFLSLLQNQYYCLAVMNSDRQAAVVVADHLDLIIEGNYLPFDPTTTLQTLLNLPDADRWNRRS